MSKVIHLRPTSGCYAVQNPWAWDTCGVCGRAMKRHPNQRRVCRLRFCQSANWAAERFPGTDYAGRLRHHAKAVRAFAPIEELISRQQWGIRRPQSLDAPILHNNKESSWKLGDKVADPHADIESQLIGRDTMREFYGVIRANRNKSRSELRRALSEAGFAPKVRR